MSLLGRKSCSAKASTIFESHLHCTKSELEDFLLQNRPFNCTGKNNGAEFGEENTVEKEKASMKKVLFR